MPRGTVTLDDLPGLGPSFARALVPSREKVAKVPAHAVSVLGYDQDPARLARYARVCGFTLRDTVPPTWLHVLAFPLHVHLLGAPEASVRLVGAVHVSNSMTSHRPVSASEPLDISVQAGNIRAHRRGALVDLDARIDVDGERVWEGVSTYLAQGMQASGDSVETTRDEFVPELPHARWRLPAKLGVDYRAVSGDPNPIHTNRLAAKAFGFPRPIIHGMWTHARALAALDNKLQAPYRVDVDFVKPVFLPGTVGFRSWATDEGWRADVTTKDGAKPHLRMRVSDLT
ncbi:MaoC/PaaZ C-terminal domain-containing protein [Demequina globuliformis]|uniref:MaoC/PaaZ C-terminal domain-containing protein n=1 Tax=Demequina globuliformis TaxID=676202 RepID=UPI0007833412|nr:MaoC/PaaZ C-terminal domain-containing protein [Demequina globuliformis]